MIYNSKINTSEVNNWKQSGKIFLWRYKENSKNYPGWNLTVDNDGGKSLLDLIDKMEKSFYPCLRTIKVNKPDKKILRVPNNKGGKAKWYSLATFKLRYANDKENNYWKLEETETYLLLSINKKGLLKLKQGILNILRGYGDYSIGPDIKKTESKNLQDIRLWIWWYVH